MNDLFVSRISALALICLCFSCFPDSEISPAQSNNTIDLSLAQQTDWQMANQVLNLINDYRTSHELTPIESDPELASAHAVSHSLYMIEMDAINHDHFQQRSSALMEQGAEMVGENVANGYTSAEAVVEAWINSSEHRAIFEGAYTHTGFGIVKNASGKYFYTLLFYKQ
ncbi:Cysteine-rich secretory protein family protein [Ulvibacter sp. MAR_2010_11]|uniref:CAP domain-containing protein n=1 Tax=Ulvibacter sp. MAR_2010_11 TaxID=1250229 RepID=UPI000C2CC61A|nr:CAP domain-containing protein [Ulvibacter sp. MAR_2010_11]PKA83120.1 Cysteine-rich secretory protein family protein [Ulvibacter sp. MAR_2010_11]